MGKNEKNNRKVPELVIDNGEDREIPSIQDSLVTILEKKMIDINEMYDEQENLLTEYANKKRELNNNEETVKFELSGLHGAKIVIQQLIEEAKDS